MQQVHVAGKEHRNVQKRAVEKLSKEQLNMKKKNICDLINKLNRLHNDWTDDMKYDLYVVLDYHRKDRLRVRTGELEWEYWTDDVL